MRLNCGIDPSKLTDEHLLAEQRELKMLPSLYGRLRDYDLSKIPSEFCLGKGHMLFFLYKPRYVLTRYKKLLNECRKRNINVKDESSRWNVYKENYSKYSETGLEARIVSNRIIEKIKSSPKQWFHYNHERITKEEAIRMLK